MGQYNKDYSGKTATEWLAERKWTGFLMRLPITKNAKGYMVENANDAMSIRATASMLSTSADCDRRFEVGVDFNSKIVSVRAIKK